MLFRSNKLEDISIDHEPQVGDIVEIEMGDTLVETYITDITEDGVIIQVDETALRLMIDAKKQLNESLNEGSYKQMMTSDAEKMELEQFLERWAQRPEDVEWCTEFYKTVNGENDEEVDEAVLGKPRFSSPQGPGKGQYSAADHVAKTKQQLGSHVYTVTTEQDGDGDFYFHIYDDAGNVLYYATDMYGQEGYHVVDDKLGKVVSSKLISDHRKATDKLFDIDNEVDEAKYQGREVPLGKPMAGDVKKSKVYVRKPNGKVVKVNFGDKKMRIKKSNPKRRKSFRARHHCENPGPRWKARYWSCRAW